jgi:hypothetical protein
VVMRQIQRAAGRHTNAFRKFLFTLCMAWSNHTGPRTFRGRKREFFPRAGAAKATSNIPGRLQSLRLFSTLLATALIDQ